MAFVGKATNPFGAVAWNLPATWSMNSATAPRRRGNGYEQVCCDRGSVEFCRTVDEDVVDFLGILLSPDKSGRFISLVGAHKFPMTYRYNDHHPAHADPFIDPRIPCPEDDLHDPVERLAKNQ